VAGAQGCKAEYVASGSLFTADLLKDVCIILFIELQCDCVGPELQAQVLYHLESEERSRYFQGKTGKFQSTWKDALK